MTGVADKHLGHVPRALAQSDTEALDVGWVILCGALVFLMQGGFTLLEAGFTRQKNTQSVLMKNIIDAAVGAICWTCCGWALAFGEDSGGLFGTTGFFVQPDTLFNDGTAAGSTYKMEWHLFFYQWTFNATTATIISGALAERCQLLGYAIMTVFCCAIYQPIVAHWAWSSNGFMFEDGFIDFAGSGVVHGLGGYVALTGAYILGPRVGRFGPNAQPIVPQSVLNICLGTFILWFGWFGFNGGSALGLSGGKYITTARVCVCTTLSASTGAMTAFTIAYYMNDRIPDVTQFANGILAGLVGVTAACSNIDTLVAMLIGIIAGILYLGGSILLEKLEIDDAVGAFPVHGVCGTWGIIAAGLFDLDKGLFNGGDGLGVQLKGMACIIAFAVLGSAPAYLALNAVGMFRSSLEQEEEGLDAHFAHSPRSVSASMNAGKIAPSDGDGQ